MLGLTLILVTGWLLLIGIMFLIPMPEGTSIYGTDEDGNSLL